VEPFGEHDEGAAVVPDTTTRTIGPRKLVTAQPISAPYSSCQVRVLSGEPSNPLRHSASLRSQSRRVPGPRAGGDSAERRACLRRRCAPSAAAR
jgi:hypothetical protein